MLSHLQVPDARAAAWWFRAACTAANQPPAEPSWEGPGDDRARAAADFCLVLLSELCAGQPAHMTCNVLKRWAGGSEGAARKELAELELLHARSNGLSLINE